MHLSWARHPDGGMLSPGNQVPRLENFTNLGTRFQDSILFLIWELKFQDWKNFRILEPSSQVTTTACPKIGRESWNLIFSLIMLILDAQSLFMLLFVMNFAHNWLILTIIK